MNVKLVIIVLQAVLIGIFLVQNLTIVEIRFLFWSFEMSRALLCLVILMAGVTAGWLISSIIRRA